MTIRTVAYVGTVALLSQILLVQGCGSNNPATGNTGGTPAATTATPTGGTPAATTATTPTGGTPAATTATTPAGGTTAATTATTPAGGTTAAGGATVTSSGGTTGAAGASGTGAFEPLCANLITAAGASPTKGGVCTSADPSLCYKTCGPKSIGFKSETCPSGGGVYAEESGCEFPPGLDYSCFKLPNPWVVDPTCPTDAAPKANSTCTVADCIPCNLNGGYFDSSGAAKTGYCVCPATSVGTPGKWTCASSTAWPCPAGQGC